MLHEKGTEVSGGAFQVAQLTKSEARSFFNYYFNNRPSGKR